MMSPGPGEDNPMTLMSVLLPWRRHANRSDVKPRKRGGIVTAATVVLLMVAIGATLWQDGNPDNALANFSSTNWLWSTNRGEVARVNGVTGRVDTRYPV